jgi:hypothetical protein
MAYYSLDHRNLFQKKHGDHVYLVRAQTKGNYAHKQDQNNHWGRAPTLSIIDHVNKKYVEARAEESLEEPKKTDTSEEDVAA